jgi:hypothetical protein
MSANANATPILDPPLPQFPCPCWGSDLLKEGFHNSCTETTRLREDNYPSVSGGTLFLEHNEDNHETIGHKCDVDAYCTSCNQLLPWTLYEIRAGLNGVNVSEADTVIAKLLAKLPESGQEGTA